MSKFDFKPLILILPFIVIIGILIVVDHPKDGPAVVSEQKTEAGKSDKEVSKDKETDKEQKKSESDTQSQQEEDTEAPFLPDQIVSESDDAQILPLIIGTYGSMEIYGGDYIYEEPNEESAQLDQLQYRAAIVLDDDQDEEDWYRVQLITNGEKGYIKKDSAIEVDLPIGSSDSVRDEIVKNAVSYLGLKFVRYGDSLEDGIDCSNFIAKIYELSDITIPTKPNDLKKAGKEISLDQARPGDIIYYDANDGYGHTAIYLGNNMIINSSGHSGKNYPRGGVRICCLVYPDRQSYQVINILDYPNDSTDEGGENE